MQDQIIDFIVAYPIVLIFLPLLAGWVLYKQLRRLQRRFEHIDARSWALVGIGLIGAAVCIALWLAWS